MSKRINIVLPVDTVRTIDRMARPGERSRFINRAVQHFVATQSQEALRQRLEQAAVRDRDLDQEVAQEWFAVDQQTWRQLEKRDQPAPTVSRSGAKSTSRHLTRR